MSESTSQHPAAPPAQTPIPNPISAPSRPSPSVHFNFSAPTSYFLPSLPTTNPQTFDPTTSNFGLISQTYTSDSSLPPSLSHGDHFSTAPPYTDWQRFAHHLSSLNSDAEQGTRYVVLYLARHGQGYHNLAESYYGLDAWDCYYSLLNGDPDEGSEIGWADAALSKLGEQQARGMNDFWGKQLREERMPVPQGWYVSPMWRASRTCEITFGTLARDRVLGGKEWKPVVKEMLRETNGIHTCDRRSARSVIASRFPGFGIEEGFSEEDELWDPVYRETSTAHMYRAKGLLDDILVEMGEANYLSLTAHGGMINAILRAVGHREFTVKVGSAIAVLVRAERVEAERPKEEFGKGATKPECKGDPLKAGLPGYRSLREYVEKVEGDAEAGR